MGTEHSQMSHLEDTLHQMLENHEKRSQCEPGQFTSLRLDIPAFSPSALILTIVGFLTQSTAILSGRQTTSVLSSYKKKSVFERTS